jgi:hypothetical protein
MKEMGCASRKFYGIGVGKLGIYDIWCWNIGNDNI